MKTYVAKPTDRERNWLVVDANGKTLGRLATQIADALRGKRKPEYTPHIDTGDFVVVINAEKISVSGKKRQDKRYYRHSGYPGGLRSRTFEEMIDASSRGDHQARRQGHDAAQSPCPQADHQAQGLRRPRAPPCRPETATDGDRGLMADEPTEHTDEHQAEPTEPSAEAPWRRPTRGPGVEWRARRGDRGETPARGAVAEEPVVEAVEEAVVEACRGGACRGGHSGGSHRGGRLSRPCGRACRRGGRSLRLRRRTPRRRSRRPRVKP